MSFYLTYVAIHKEIIIRKKQHEDSDFHLFFSFLTYFIRNQTSSWSMHHKEISVTGIGETLIELNPVGLQTVLGM